MRTALLFDRVSVHVTEDRARRSILRHLDLQVTYGSAVALVGPSGSGKTTALRVAACSIRPSEGRVEILGWDSRLIRGARVAAVRRMVGIVPQGSPWGREHRSVEAALLRTVRASRRGGSRPEARLAEVLELTGTSHLATSDVQTLSIGEVRRVSIARALLTRPHALLLDEPTANLDDRNAEAVLRLVANARSAGLAVLTATHDPRLTGIADTVVTVGEPA